MNTDEHFGEPYGCLRCPIRNHCLPAGLNAETAEQLSHLCRPSLQLKPKDTVVWAGEPLEALYAVRSGCLKLSQAGHGGGEQIQRFAFPGDMIGLDALFHRTHQCDVIALETARLCVFPYSALQRLSGREPAIQEQLARLASKYWVDRMRLSWQSAAEDRLAAFLLELADGSGETETFRVPMARKEVACYLGLAAETVTRLLGHLQRQGLIAVEGRSTIRLRNRHRLGRMAQRARHGNY